MLQHYTVNLYILHSELVGVGDFMECRDKSEQGYQQLQVIEKRESTK